MSVFFFFFSTSVWLWHCNVSCIVHRDSGWLTGYWFVSSANRFVSCRKSLASCQGRLCSKSRPVYWVLCLYFTTLHFCWQGNWLNSLLIFEEESSLSKLVCDQSVIAHLCSESSYCTGTKVHTKFNLNKQRWEKNSVGCTRSKQSWGFMVARRAADIWV